MSVHNGAIMYFLFILLALLFMAVSAVVGADNHMSIFDDALALHEDLLQVTVHFFQLVLDLPEDTLALLIFGCEGTDDVLDLR